MSDHFGDKVPDFKADHYMIQQHAPVTMENIDPDDLVRLIPQFVPVQVSHESANTIAREVSSSARAMLVGHTDMSDFQLDYLQRCIRDAVQQMMLGQDVWQWQIRYEQAFARGEVPDTRED